MKKKSCSFCKRGGFCLWRKELGIPVIIIAGPTGSGKTAVGIELVKKLRERGLDGEIISADSRSIYKGCDIGTAKPSREERGDVTHFGFDLALVGEKFSVAQFKRYALEKIEEIKTRGAVPIVVGGTGLYLDALFFDYSFKKGRKKAAKDRSRYCTNYLFIGIKTEKEELRERLRKRLNKIFVQELYDELEGLLKEYPEAEKLLKEGTDSEVVKAVGQDRKEIYERLEKNDDFDLRKKYKALTSNVYKFAYMVMKGKMTEEEAKEKAFYADWGLARRQMTWFRRNKQIVWLDLDKVCEYVLKLLCNE